MKTTLIAVVLVFAVIVALLFLLGRHSKNGQAQGLIDDSLALCGNKPNCVCSEKQIDETHSIEPIRYTSKSSEIVSTLKRAIENMGGRINQVDDTYIAATFASRLFGFTDDLEIRIEPESQLIQVRSASRVGYSDRGVNRNRVEALRLHFK